MVLPSGGGVPEADLPGPRQRTRLASQRTVEAGPHATGGAAHRARRPPPVCEQALEIWDGCNARSAVAR